MMGFAGGVLVDKLALRSQPENIFHFTVKNKNHVLRSFRMKVLQFSPPPSTSAISVINLPLFVMKLVDGRRGVVPLCIKRKVQMVRYRPKAIPRTIPTQAFLKLFLRAIRLPDIATVHILFKFSFPDFACGIILRKNLLRGRKPAGFECGIKNVKKCGVIHFS